MKTGSIRKKLLVIISLGIFIPLVVIMVVSALKFKEYSLEIAKSSAISHANEYGNEIKQELNKVFIAANTFADIYNANVNEDGVVDFSVKEIHKMQEKFLQANNQALVIYADFLPQKIVTPSGQLNEQTVMIGDVNSNGKFSVWEEWNYQFKSDVVSILKKNNGVILTDPYEDEVEGNKVMMISYGKEIKHKGEIIGIVGVDFAIDWMQELINTKDLFDGMADVCIVSGKGTIMANNKRKELVCTNIEDLEDCTAAERVFLNSAQQGVIQEDKMFKFYIPIKFGENNELWHVRISVPQKAVLKDSVTQIVLRMLFVLSLVVLALGTSFFYLNKIIKRIVSLSNVAEEISGGSFNVEFDVDGNDEIRTLADSLQQMINKFKNVIINIKKTTDQLYKSGTDLSNVAIKLSEGASEQASSTEEVSASMEEMTANIEQNAENSKIADSIARKSTKGIELSSQNVIQTTKSMGEIANKTSVIGDIAFQTNILALNAAVEAARAGVHGKGFGVVAAEVGKLADNSKKAASEIDELTNKSFGIAKKSAELLEQIAPDINKTAQLVQEITNASMEQKSGTEQINNAIQQLNKVTQENAGSAELLATNVEALNALADKLNKLIDFFKIDNHEPDIEKESVVTSNVIEPENKVIEKVTVEKPKIKNDTEGFSFNLDTESAKDDEFEKF